MVEAADLAERHQVGKEGKQEKPWTFFDGQHHTDTQDRSHNGINQNRTNQFHARGAYRATGSNQVLKSPIGVGLVGFTVGFESQFNGRIWM